MWGAELHPEGSLRTRMTQRMESLGGRDEKQQKEDGLHSTHQKKEVRWATDEEQQDADRIVSRPQGPLRKSCIKTLDQARDTTGDRSGMAEATPESYNEDSSSDEEVRILSCRRQARPKTKALEERSPVDRQRGGICRCSRCESAWLHRGWVCPLADDDQSRDGTSLLGPKQS